MSLDDQQKKEAAHAMTEQIRLDNIRALIAEALPDTRAYLTELPAEDFRDALLNAFDH